LHVNGKEVSGVSECRPRKGYLALESEGAECHFKNIRIKELPSTNPKPEETAKGDEGFKSLFTGLDLSGWKTEKGAWKVSGGKLVFEGPSLNVTDKTRLVSEKKFGPCELIVDWKMSNYSGGTCVVNVAGVKCMARAVGYKTSVWKDVEKGKDPSVKRGARTERGVWNRSVIRFDGTKLSFTVNGMEAWTLEAQKPIEAQPIWITDELDHVKLGLEVMNVFVRELKEKK
jgi:hypothetical protein